jgi:hypothetical protein
MDGKKTQLVTINIYSYFIKFLYNTQNCLKDVKLNPLSFTQKKISKNFLRLTYTVLCILIFFIIYQKLYAYTRT